MDIEIRNGKLTLSGYANVAERQSRTLHDKDGEFIETVASGAFAHALRDNPKPEIRLNHDRVLSVTDLDVAEDSIGLKVSFSTDDNEIRELVEHDRLTGWSFAFSHANSNYEVRDGVRYRRLLDFDLHEISILSVLPAYIAMSVENRDAESVEYRSNSESVDVEIDDTEIKALGQLNTYKQHFEFIKGE